jgi:phosphatidate phosphatase PAH1
MNTQEFIQKVAAGEASEAKDILNDILSSRAFETLDEKKQQIAQSLYSNGEDIEVQDTADTPMEDELLTQEEFDELSEEDQELYLEYVNQLDEVSLGLATKAYKKRADKAYDSENPKDINKQTDQHNRIIKKFGDKGRKAVTSVTKKYDNYSQ